REHAPGRVHAWNVAVSVERWQLTPATHDVSRPKDFIVAPAHGFGVIAQIVEALASNGDSRKFRVEPLRFGVARLSRRSSAALSFLRRLGGQARGGPRLGEEPPRMRLALQAFALSLKGARCFLERRADAALADSFRRHRKDRGDLRPAQTSESLVSISACGPVKRA